MTLDSICLIQNYLKSMSHLNEKLLLLSLLDLLVHGEGLYMWDEVATPSSFLIACNLEDLLSIHQLYKRKFENNSLCVQS